MNYNSDYNLPLRIGFVVLIGAWRCWQMTRRPRTPESTAITAAILTLAASLVFEALAEAQSEHGQRAYILAAVQNLFLFGMFAALTAYYAAADGTRKGQSIAWTVATIGTVTAAVNLLAGIAVDPNRRLWDFQHLDSLTYYVTTSVFFPVACAGSSLLAYRIARRSTGPLRPALGLSSIALGVLTIVSAFTPYAYWVGHRHGIATGTGPQAAFTGALGVFMYVGFIGGCLLLVISFAAVAIAHRGRQLTATWAAWRDVRTLRHLRDDLSLIAPEKSFPRTGWTPMLLLPHAARVTACIEVRDRLVMVSPALAAELDPADHCNPLAVAGALHRLHNDGIAHKPLQIVPAVPILTAASAGEKDLLIPTARHYAQLKTQTTK